MSEKTKKFLPWILKGVAALFAILALVFMFVLPGVSYSAKEQGVSGKMWIVMSSLVFGGGVVKVDTLGVKLDMFKFKGGLSIFGLIAFVLLVVGLIALVLSFVLKDKSKIRVLDIISKLFVLIAGGAFLVAGVCALLITVAGTSVTTTELLSSIAAETKVSFKEFLENMNLGTGAILFAVFGILSGATLLVDQFVIEK